MRRIPVGRKQYAFVDDAIYLHLSQWRWNTQTGNCSTDPYAKRMVWVNGKNYTIFMHHQVLGRIPEVQVDHYNGNTLDNRLVNLRFVSQSQNLLNGHKQRINRTGYRGVTLRHGKYHAQIKVDKTYRSLGTYDTAERAGQAYFNARTCALRQTPRPTP